MMSVDLIFNREESFNKKIGTDRLFKCESDIVL